MTRSRLWNVGTVLVVLVIVAAGWLLVVSPKRTDASTLRAQAVAAVAQNQQVEGKIRELKLQQQQLPAQQAQIAAINQQIPSQPQLPTLIRQLDDAASAADVTLGAITPGTFTAVPSDTGVSYIPLSITVSGSFTNLKAYLSALETNPRAVLVTGFKINPATATAGAANTPALPPNTLALTVTARVFVAGSGTASGTTASTAAPTAAATPTTTAPASSGTAN